MKKKIALYTNGFSLESLWSALDGIKEYAKTEDFDIIIFTSFATYGPDRGHTRGELNIYTLGRMEDFDGIIVFSNHLNSPRTAIDLCRKAKEKNIPVVSIGMPIDGIPYINFANEDGMRVLVTHLVENHGVKRIVFMAGAPDHPDSNARIETTREVLKEHGLRLSDEDIEYGDWGSVPPVRLVDRLVESGDLPDALLCANDAMAMSAMNEFIDLGYSVPKDMIITGFDHISEGIHYCPALTTVDPNFKEIGYQCCEMLFDMIYGRNTELNRIVSSRFSCAESCGCKDPARFIPLREQHCRISYKFHIESNAIEIYERVLRHRISEVTDYASLKSELRRYYEEFHFFEGREFYILVNPKFFEDALTKEDELLRNGYQDKMDVIVAFKDGRILSDDELDLNRVIPAYKKNIGEQHIYYLLPLHYQEYNYGYMIFADEAPILMQNLVSPYLEKLQLSFKLLRINMRLDSMNRELTQLYNRDPMTGLYNRLAYEEKADVYFRKSLEDKTTMMVMFVDINYMKRINDQYGHLHGDNAIKTVAESIKTVLNDSRIAVRFGGDEFLVIAPDCTEEDAAKIRRDILAYLEEKNQGGTQPYEISASCGYVITDPDSSYTLKDYVKEADNLMYKIKQDVHARDGKPRN